MPHPSRVSIYAVRSNGSTGERKGSGALVDPGVVLVAPPLSRRLAGSSRQHRLRLGIASSSGDDVEVLEVAGTTVARGRDGVLVLLETGTRAQSPCDDVAGLDGAADVEGLVAAGLAHLGDSAAPEPGTDPAGRRAGSAGREPGPAEPGPVEPGPVEPGPAEPGPTDVGTPEPRPSDDASTSSRTPPRSIWCRMLGVACP